MGLASFKNAKALLFTVCVVPAVAGLFEIFLYYLLFGNLFFFKEKKSTLVER